MQVPIRSFQWVFAFSLGSRPAFLPSRLYFVVCVLAAVFLSTEASLYPGPGYTRHMLARMPGKLGVNGDQPAIIRRSPSQGYPHPQEQGNPTQGCSLVFRSPFSTPGGPGEALDGRFLEKIDGFGRSSPGPGGWVWGAGSSIEVRVLSFCVLGVVNAEPGWVGRGFTGGLETRFQGCRIPPCFPPSNTKWSFRWGCRYRRARIERPRRPSALHGQS